MVKYLLDAIEQINIKRNEENSELENTDEIYMISPIFMTPTFKKIHALEFFEKFGFETAVFEGDKLQDDEYLEANPEAQIAKDVFGGDTTEKGKQKSIGRVKIKFEKINSKQWQRKKKIIKNGIKLLEKKDKEIDDDEQVR